MCNLYAPSGPQKISMKFAVGAPVGAYAATVAPLKPGPIVVPDRALIAQWGLIPPFSRTRTPTLPNGGRMSTNNARRERMATAPTYRDAWRKGHAPVQILKQHRRARPSGHQADHPTDDGIQIILERQDHHWRNRDHAHDQERADGLPSRIHHVRSQPVLWPGRLISKPTESLLSSHPHYRNRTAFIRGIPLAPILSNSRDELNSGNARRWCGLPKDLESISRMVSFRGRLQGLS